MAFKDEDFVEIEYSAWDTSANRLIATTDERKAKESEIYNKDYKYGKVLVVLGSNSVIKGLDKEIRTMSIGEQKKFTVKPEDAFGQRNEELVKVMPLSDFRARDMNPYPGMTVELDNMTVIVRSVNSGRVVVDANNPYAGRDITYEVKVIKQITNQDEKITALGRTYNVEPSKVNVSDKKLMLKYDSNVSKNADYFVGKVSAIASIFTYFKGIEDIVVEEEYKRVDLEKPGHTHEHKHEQKKEVE